MSDEQTASHKSTGSLRYIVYLTRLEAEEAHLLNSSTSGDIVGVFPGLRVLLSMSVSLSRDNGWKRALAAQVSPQVRHILGYQKSTLKFEYIVLRVLLGQIVYSRSSILRQSLPAQGCLQMWAFSKKLIATWCEEVKRTIPCRWIRDHTKADTYCDWLNINFCKLESPECRALPEELPWLIALTDEGGPTLTVNGTLWYCSR